MKVVYIILFFQTKFWSANLNVFVYIHEKNDARMLLMNLVCVYGDNWKVSVLRIFFSFRFLYDDNLHWAHWFQFSRLQERRNSESCTWTWSLQLWMRVSWAFAPLDVLQIVIIYKSSCLFCLFVVVFIVFPLFFLFCCHFDFLGGQCWYVPM